MRYHPLFNVFTVLAVFALSFFSFASTAQAEGFATVGTTLTIDHLEPVSVGYISKVTIHLISSKGKPVENQAVELFVNGESVRRSRTDASGTLSINVRRDEVGTYTLLATFKGSKLPSLGSSKATAELMVMPAVVEVHTTPSLPNVKFSLDNQIFSSDGYGVARMEVKKAGNYHLKILPLENLDPDIQMNFSRWGDDIFQPGRDIKVPLDKPLQAGFEVSYLVNQTFVDLSDKPVDLSRITSVTLKGSNGTTYTFEDHQPHWLPAGRVIRLNNGLQETKILYSIISVVIDGSNVVSQAQQRYYVHPNDLWSVKLLLYSARFTAHDALFGFPVGSGVHVEYPDGDVQAFVFNSQKEHQSEGLARGIYRVTVTGAKGIAPPTPIALSRDQDVQLLVFSYLDIGVLAGIGLFLSLGLLLFGHPYLIRQTITLPSRAISGIRTFGPVLVKELHNKIIAFGSRIVFKKGNVRLDSSGDVIQDSTGVETIHSPIVDQAQYKQDISEVEIPDVLPDRSNDEMNDTAQQMPSPTVQTEILLLAPGPAVDVEAVTHSEITDIHVPNDEKPDSAQKVNNFGPKRPRRSRHKRKVESLV
ncbi:MAG TPA: hypothetical protein VK249_20080 [Anaerolineales bacterium]|nr:hypothetical protein [Anaerolineales bacterium]